MASSNYTQTSFLGGEWSAFAQGRTDLPTYRTAMNVCLNGFPVEEGAWTRRPGFIDLGCTHKGREAVIRPFSASVTQGLVSNGLGGTKPAAIGEPTTYLVEFSSTTGVGADPSVRFWVPQSGGYPTLLTKTAVSITSFSAASPALMTVGSAQTWVTGDTVLIAVDSGTAANAGGLAGVQFIVTKVSTTTFTLQYAATATNVDGSGITYTSGTAHAAQIVVLPTYNYFGIATDPDPKAYACRFVQSGQYAMVFDGRRPGELITITPSAAVSVTEGSPGGGPFFLSEADGPYIDPLPGTSQTGNKTATATTADGLTYTVTIGSDGAAFSFSANDVGRCFRIWTQPPPIRNGTFNTGDTMTYNGNFWKCLSDGVFVVPGQPQVISGVSSYPWQLTPTLGKWTSTYISAYTSASVVNVRIAFNEAANPLTRLTIDTWQIGLIMSTTNVVANRNQGPICGGWLDGRLWLGGIVAGRFDLSMSNAFEDYVAGLSPLFSPTDAQGVVLDNSAISETVNAKGSNDVLWFAPDKQGMMLGTSDGAWLVQASTGASIIPTDINTSPISRYKTAFIEPLRIGSVLAFVQSVGRKMYEFLVDSFSNRFVARPLNAMALHLPGDHGGIKDIAYQEDPVPVVWAAAVDGTLLGSTYRRISDWATQPPEFIAWHEHAHGASRTFFSVAMGTALNGQDALAATTYDATQGAYHVEMMSQIWGPV